MKQRSLIHLSGNLMTDNPILHALVDLVQAIEKGQGMIDVFDPAYGNALKLIRENTCPAAERADK